MPASRRPGQNIRQLARQRRVEAIRSFLAAVALGAFLVIITLYFTASPIYIYALGVFSIVAFIVGGRNAWQGDQRISCCDRNQCQAQQQQTA